MIFRRAIVAELSNTAGGVFTVLFTIAFSVVLVRILGDAAGGRADGQAVFALVALTALTYLPTILTLTVFISVLITVTRAYRDSEMVVWFSTGQSLLAWVRPVLRFAAPVILLNIALALVVTPWSNRQIVESRKRFEQRDDVSKMAPGRFIESGSAQRVFFVESVDLEGGTVKNVFVSHRSQGREGVTVAASGIIEVRGDGDRYLVLSQGRRYEGQPGEAEYRMLEFERYAIRLDTRPDEPLTEVAQRAKTTVALWEERTPFSMAELMWRVGLPIVTFTLAMLAIPLGYLNPRIGRSSNLIIAIIVFLLYNSATSTVQAYVQQERLPFAVGVWLTHSVVLAAALLLLWRRVYLQRWWPRRVSVNRNTVQ